MLKALIVAEHFQGQLSPGAAKCLDCAARLGDVPVDIVVCADDAAAVAAQAATLAGVSRIIKLEHPAFANPLAAQLVPPLAVLVESYSHVFGPSSTFGKDLMPRLAALLGVGLISDVIQVESPYRFRRPIHAGNAVITVEASPEHKLMATVRTAAFQAASQGGNASIESFAVTEALPAHTRFVSRSGGQSNRPDLQSAARVVSGGRALGSVENFRMIYSLADKLGAGVAASRAAVDAGYADNDMQVGQTGKIIAPELYIAVGISGAIQHLTGIRDARTVVAINKDPEAPIFELADVGLVGDLFDILPELERQL
ncbi:MAG: electron transfer flavoprotein subunit alpha/FixB family protein [Steroidobacteraceae bacterium]